MSDQRTVICEFCGERVTELSNHTCRPTDLESSPQPAQQWRGEVDERVLPKEAQPTSEPTSEIEQLKNMKDEDIDTSDIPETDFTGAEVGKFYRKTTSEPSHTQNASPCSTCGGEGVMVDGRILHINAMADCPYANENKKPVADVAEQDAGTLKQEAAKFREDWVKTHDEIFLAFVGGLYSPKLLDEMLAAFARHREGRLPPILRRVLDLHGVGHDFSHCKDGRCNRCSIETDVERLLRGE